MDTVQDLDPGIRDVPGRLAVSDGCTSRSLFVGSELFQRNTFAIAFFRPPLRKSDETTGRLSGDR